MSLLQYGILTPEQIREAEDMKRNELLSRHPYKVWQSVDGRYCTYIPMPGGKRKFIKLKNRRELEDKILQTLNRGPTFEQIFNEWNRERLNRKVIRPATYDQNQRIYDRFCSDFGQNYLSELTADSVAHFLEELPNSGTVTAKAFANCKTIVKGTLKRAKRMNLISFPVVTTMEDLDVSSGSFKRRAPRPTGECFNDHEARTVIAYCKEHPDIQNLGILLLFPTGMRVGELVALEHSDIVQVPGGYSVSVTKTETIYKGPDGKTVYAVGDRPKTEAGQRTIIVPDAWGWNWLFTLLRQLDTGGPYVFMRNGKRITTNSIKRRLSRVCEWSGIPHKSAHMIRKAYGTILLDNHADAQLIRSQMGHTSIGTTEQYYHKDRKNTEQKIRLLSDIPGLGA